MLSPLEGWIDSVSDSNIDSVVVMVSLGEDSVLFAAEPEEPAQQVLLDEGVALGADVLKVPHHGGATSLPGFFDAVHPQLAVVSVGSKMVDPPVVHRAQKLVARARAMGLAPTDAASQQN